MVQAVICCSQQLDFASSFPSDATLPDHVGVGGGRTHDVASPVVILSEIASYQMTKCAIRQAQVSRCDNQPIQSLHFNTLESVNGWSAIDDRVRGGVAQSRLTSHPEGRATFKGEVSRQNGGGFAFVRHAQL